MTPQTVNTKMNKMLLRGKIVRASVFAAMVFSVVMMTGYRKLDNSVFITDNGVTKEIKTNESDIYEILRSEDYTLGTEDRVSFTKDENNSGHIEIHRAFDVTVSADGEKKRLTVLGGKVSDILEKADVKVGNTDKVSHAPDEEVTAGMNIEITRIRYAERKQEEDLPFETKYIDDPNVVIGRETVVTEGKNGQRTTVYKDTYVNGKLEKTERVSDSVKQPVTEVIKRGVSLATPYNQNTPDSVKLVNGVPESYTRVITGKSTAYSAPAGAGTASGRLAEVGTVAVNPNVIPYGSELYIVSHDGLVYGYAIAADTGLGMMDGTVLVDLFMGSYEDSCDWGAHTVDIYVISEGNG